MSRVKTISIVVAVFLAVGLGVWLLDRRGEEGSSPLNLETFKLFGLGGWGGASEAPKEEAAPAESAEFEPTPAQGPGRAIGNRFVSEKYGFSFEIPEGFKSSNFPDEKGELVVVEKGPKEGFQIYIAPFDTGGPLTPQFIRSEVPDMPMQNVRTAKLDSVPSVVFESANDDIGRTFEVWLAYPESPVPHGNYIYQITAYREFAGELTNILQTWKFE